MFDYSSHVMFCCPTTGISFIREGCLTIAFPIFFLAHAYDINSYLYGLQRFELLMKLTFFLILFSFALMFHKQRMSIQVINILFGFFSSKNQLVNFIYFALVRKIDSVQALMIVLNER